MTNLVKRWWHYRRLSPTRRVLAAMWTFGFNRRTAADIAERAVMRLAEVEQLLTQHQRQNFVVSDWSRCKRYRLYWLAPRGLELAQDTVDSSGTQRAAH